MKKIQKQTTKKSRIATIDKQPQEEPALATIDPDWLRDSVREALSRLSEVEQRIVSNDLLAALKEAGVNVGHHLLLLGIPARTAEEVTAAEMGILVRYVRISEQRAMAALSPILSEVLGRQDSPIQRVRPSKRAA